MKDIIWTVFVDADFDTNVTWKEVQNAKRQLSAAILGQISVTRGNAPCVVSVKDFALARRGEENFLSVTLATACPRRGLASVGGALFMSGDASQRVLLSAKRKDGQLNGVMSAAAPNWQEPAQASAW